MFAFFPSLGEACSVVSPALRTSHSSRHDMFLDTTRLPSRDWYAWCKVDRKVRLPSSATKRGTYPQPFCKLWLGIARWVCAIAAGT